MLIATWQIFLMFNDAIKSIIHFGFRTNHGQCLIIDDRVDQDFALFEIRCYQGTLGTLDLLRYVSSQNRLIATIRRSNLDLALSCLASLIHEYVLVDVSLNL